MPPVSARPVCRSTPGATPEGRRITTRHLPVRRGCSRFAIPYGVKHCTDGTSNTVAYAEWLVGDGRGMQLGGATPASHYRGNMSAGVSSVGTDPGTIYDAFSNPQAFLDNLQACTVAFQTAPTVASPT